MIKYDDTDSVYDVSSLYPSILVVNNGIYGKFGGRGSGKTFMVESFFKGVFNGDEHAIVGNIPFSTSPREIYTVGDMIKRYDLMERCFAK